MHCGALRRLLIVCSTAASEVFDSVVVAQVFFEPPAPSTGKVRWVCWPHELAVAVGFRMGAMLDRLYGRRWLRASRYDFLSGVVMERTGPNICRERCGSGCGEQVRGCETAIIGNANGGGRAFLYGSENCVAAMGDSQGFEAVASPLLILAVRGFGEWRFSCITRATRTGVL